MIVYTHDLLFGQFFIMKLFTCHLNKVMEITLKNHSVYKLQFANRFNLLKWEDRKACIGIENVTMFFFAYCVSMNS